MEKTKIFLKSFIDGFAAYFAYYLLTSLLIWIGFIALDLIKVGYWQCVGGLIILRQLIAIFVKPTNLHIKEKTVKQNNNE